MPKPSLDTQQFASLLGIKESELVFALKSDGFFLGQQLPSPIDRACWRSRRFRFDDVIAFKRTLEVTRGLR